MISVICAECGEVFEISEEAAGEGEYCPACGTLNEIPSEAPQEAPAPAVPAAEPPPAAELPAAIAPDNAPESRAIAAGVRGMPSPLWWGILLGALLVFAAGCVYFFSDDWESRNIAALSEAANRGDALMIDQDFPAAAQQYEFVLTAVGKRQIQSTFLLNLIDHSRVALADAQRHMRAPAPAVAATAASPAGAEAPASNHPSLQLFQRRCEAFPAFIARHPIVFKDANGQWRRRRFVVWQLVYDDQAEARSEQISLRFDCASSITEAHPDRASAMDDDTFNVDESPKIEDCTTHFHWSKGNWMIAGQEAQPEPEQSVSIHVRPSLDDFYALERRAFASEATVR